MTASRRLISLWSGPRNVSTALMYSFARLDNIRVVDEPLYAHYLRSSGAQHPGRDDVLASMESDGNRVMDKLLEQQAQNPQQRFFLKQMAHHLVDINTDFLARIDNVLLVRDPRDMLPSLTIQLPDASLADTGLDRQWRLYESLREIDRAPLVLDSRVLLLNPRKVLTRLCERLGLRFDERMLSWPAGPRAEDGVWAKHWYHSVHRSTGFSPYEPKTDFPPRLEELLGHCQPWYEKLKAVALRAE